jgi:6,7-dimethyl-8-ribityllumazine synthase
MPKNSAPAIDCSGKRFVIITSRFYPQIAEWLEAGARRGLQACNVRQEDIRAYSVPGCFELPPAASRVISEGKVDAIVALGAVVRGETAHFDYVAGETAHGIMDVQLATGVPIGFGVLTTDTLEQAEFRADPKRGDKGYHAALAAATLLRIPADTRVPAR